MDQIYCLKEGSLLKNGCYQIDQVLGEGGFSIIYLGTHVAIGSKIVVKELYFRKIMKRELTGVDGNCIGIQENDETVSYDELFLQFKKSARLLSKVDKQDGIAKILDFFEENNTAYIVMEYIKGVRLDKYVKKNRLSPDKILELLRPLANTIETLHEYDIIHRDISPENILVSEKKGSQNVQVVLIDYGSAIQSGITDQPQTIVKDGYSAPEQYGTAILQKAYTDVYAFCATAYYLLTGKNPQKAPDRGKNDLLKQKLMRAEGIGMDRKKVLLKGLSLSAEERYQSMEELNRALYTCNTAHERSRWQFRKGRLRKYFTYICAAVLVIGLMKCVFFLVKTSRFELPFITDDQGFLILDLSDMNLCDLDFLEKLDREKRNRIKEINLSGNYLLDISGLQYLSGVEVLDLSNNAELKDISVLSFMENMKNLDLSNNCSITDFSSILDMKKLQMLDLSNISLDDIHFISGLNQLESLAVENCDLTDGSVIAGMGQLEELRIGWNTGCNLQKILNGLDQLKVLYVDGYMDDRKIDFSKCQNLETLNISHTRIGLEQLSPLTELKHLYLYDRKVDGQALGEMQNLESLYLGNKDTACMRVKEFTDLPFEKLVNIRKLVLDLEYIQEQDCFSYIPYDKTESDIPQPYFDLTGIAKLTNLKSLKVSGNILVGRITPLSRLSLEELELDAVCCFSLGHLRKFKYLKKLSILDKADPEKARRKDLHYLSKLGGLEELDIDTDGSFVRLSELDHLVNLKSLRLCGLVSEEGNEGYFSSMESLEELELEIKGDSIDFSKINNLPSLRKLSISGKEISDLDFLMQLDQLERLHIHLGQDKGVNLPHLDFLNQMPKLIALRLDNLKIQDTGGFEEASSLLSLCITNCEFIGQMDAMQGLRSLSSLTYKDSVVKEITPFSKLKYLSYLNLDNSEIKKEEVASAGFRNLKEVSVRETGLQSIGWMKRSDQLRKVDISSTSVKDLSALAAADNLQEFCAETMDSLENIDALQGTRHIETFTLTADGKSDIKLPVSDISPLADNKHMHSLKICGTNVKDLSSLEEMKAVRRLDLSDNEQIECLNGMGQMKSLCCLSLNGCTELSDINVISSLKNLDVLELSGCIGLKDISPIYNLNMLTSLDLNGCTSLAGHLDLNQLSELDSLFMKKVPVSDLSCIQNLNQLRILDAGRSALKDISALAGKHKLKVLNLAYTQVKDLECLSECKSLKRIRLKHTPVISIADLRNLPLTSLNVQETNIKNLYQELVKFQTKDDITLYYDDGRLTDAQIKKLENANWFLET